MNIIYLHQFFKKPSMSGGVRSYEQAKRMVNDGHKVIMITSDTINDFNGWKVEDIDGIEVHWISVKYDNKFSFFKRLFSFFKFIILSTLHILKIESELVYATSTPLTIAIPAIIYNKVKKIPYIFEVRDVWPEVPIALGMIRNRFLKSIANKLEEVAYRNAKYIVALSSDMKESIFRRYGFTNIKVIPNASDVPLFRGRIINTSSEIYSKLSNIRKKHRFIVFYTGTFGMVNNLEYLIRLASYSDGDIGFVIVGSGKEEVDLKLLADELEVNNRVVHFIGRVNKDELFLLHRMFDMACSTVLPIRELFSNSANKVFDAFASGTPLMINHEGWIKDVIEKNRCGIVLPPVADINAFSQLSNFSTDNERVKIARDCSRKLGDIDFNRDTLYRELSKCIA